MAQIADVAGVHQLEAVCDRSLHDKAKALDSTAAALARSVGVDDDSCVTQMGRQAACVKVEAARRRHSPHVLDADLQNPPCPAKLCERLKHS